MPEVCDSGCGTEAEQRFGEGGGDNVGKGSLSVVGSIAVEFGQAFEEPGIAGCGFPQPVHLPHVHRKLPERFPAAGCPEELGPANPEVQPVGECLQMGSDVFGGLAGLSQFGVEIGHEETFRGRGWRIGETSGQFLGVLCAPGQCQKAPVVDVVQHPCLVFLLHDLQGALVAGQVIERKTDGELQSVGQGGSVSRDFFAASRASRPSRIEPGGPQPASHAA